MDWRVNKSNQGIQLPIFKQASKTVDFGLNFTSMMFYVVVWSENKNFWMTAVLGWVGGWSCHFVTNIQESDLYSHSFWKVISFSLKATSSTRAFLFFHTRWGSFSHTFAHSSCLPLNHMNHKWEACVFAHIPVIAWKMSLSLYENQTVPIFLLSPAPSTVSTTENMLSNYLLNRWMSIRL